MTRRFRCCLPSALSFTIAVFVGCICPSGSRAALIHRYSFNDPDSAKDSVGHVDGKLKGSAKIADGRLVLKNDDAGRSDDAQLSYLEFSGPILPKKGSVSIVAWFTATDVGPFARIFNFSDKDDADGRAFIYFVPRNSDDQSRAAISATDIASKTAQDNDRLDDGSEHMVAVVIDGDAKKMHVFIDGKEHQPPQDLGDNTLDAVRQTNNWLGRSSFDQDPGLTGSINEFRVYDQALGADQIAAIAKAGPDSLPPPATQPTSAP